LDRLGVKAKEPEAKEPEAEKPKVKEPEAEKPKVKEPEAEKPKGQEPDKFPGQALIDLEQWLSDINNLKLSNMEESRIDRIRSLSIHHIDNVRHMVKLAKKPRYIRADVAQEVKEAVATAAPHLADLIKRHTIAQIMNVDGEMDVPDFSGAITAARNALHRQLLSLAKKDETTAASTDGRIRSTRDLAERFAAHIMQEHPEIKAQVWERGDKMRVYVKQYVNGRPVEYGHYDIKRTADEVEIVSNLNTTHTGRLLSRLPRPFIQSVDLDM
jgi:hypothetical protein